MIRNGLHVMLGSYPDFQIVGEAEDGDMATLAYARKKPDIVLMDMMMPRVDGITATQRIIEADPRAKIIALTGFNSEDMVQKALQAGALGYLVKNVGGDELAQAIRTANAGKRFLAPEAADALVHAVTHPIPTGHDLTERERQVLGYMIQGLNNTEIARELVLSTSTVKFHVSSILNKLNVSSRVEAVAFAVRHGLLETAQAD